MRTCAYCRTPFPATGTRVYCSAQCKQTVARRKRGVPPKPSPSTPLNWQSCAWCQRWYVKRYGRVTCSGQCKAERKKFLAREDHTSRYVSRAVTNPEVDHVCPECGDAFTSVRYSGQRIYCSTTCTARAAHRTRRHRERQAQREGEHFTTREIAERDGWRCHLCGLKVPDEPDGHEPSAPTIDHLVPLSLGGQHTRSNVALAHRSCNTQRSTGGTAQLRLVG